MIEPSSVKQAHHSAIDYLSRREHASQELHNKLLRKGFEEYVINRVLTQLRVDNLQSDERFAESYIRSRTNKGFGPLRIQQELRERGITEELLQDMLESSDTDWIKLARQAKQKRFGQNLPQNQRELAKQIRFMQYRGFTSSQVKAALSGV